MLRFLIKQKKSMEIYVLPMELMLMKGNHSTSDSDNELHVKYRSILSKRYMYCDATTTDSPTTGQPTLDSVICSNEFSLGLSIFSIQMQPNKQKFAITTR